MEEQGMSESKKYELKLKPSFMKSETYTSGYVYTNTKEEVPQKEKELSHYDKNWQHYEIEIDNDSNVFKLSEKQSEKFNNSEVLQMEIFNEISIRSILNRIPPISFCTIKRLFTCT